SQCRSREIKVKETGWVSSDTSSAGKTRQGRIASYPRQSWGAGPTSTATAIGLTIRVRSYDNLALEYVQRYDEITLCRCLRDGIRSNCGTCSRESTGEGVITPIDAKGRNSSSSATAGIVEVWMKSVSLIEDSPTGNNVGQADDLFDLSTRSFGS